MLRSAACIEDACIHEEDAMPTIEMTCPKCASTMVSFERNGVTVEQCTGCRGVFLDRGELEQLIDAESRYIASGSVDPRAANWPLPRQSPRSSGHAGGHGSSGHDGRQSGRRGFLGGLFD
jgi:hypothetical protein